MLPNKKPVLLVVGLYSYGTGFTNVLENLCAQWCNRYTIHWLGIGYSGELLYKNNYTLHPNNVNGGDMYGAYTAATMALELEANFVFILNDLYMFKNYQTCLTPLKEKNIKLIGYIPLDGYMTNPNIVKQISFLDTAVFYAKWAKDEVVTAFEKINAVTIPDCVVIPHGIDTSIFAKVNNEEIIDLKKTIFFTIEDTANAIFILNANRNAERKDIDTTLEGFAKGLPYFTQPAYLCLHQPAITFIQKEELESKIKLLRLENHVIINPLGEAYITPAQLSNLYHCCSIGVNTSFGEGWGLISFEHAACGAAQIVPAHTTAGEVWNNVGICIPNDYAVQLNSNPFLMYKVNAEILSEQLVALVNDKDYLQKISTQCHKYSTQEKFSWAVIAKEWYNLFS
jgi:D-inositol-3-phosphate glycosyltransferase